MDTQALLDALVSHAVASGYFERVNAYEPKNAPGNGLSAAIWIQSLAPSVRSSGLNTSTMIMTATVRIYSSMLAEPTGEIDPGIMSAASALFSVYSSDFTLDGLIKNVDLLGMEGATLSGKAGYLNVNNKMYRVFDLTVPMVINDVYVQAP